MSDPKRRTVEQIAASVCAYPRISQNGPCPQCVEIAAALTRYGEQVREEERGLVVAFIRALRPYFADDKFRPFGERGLAVIKEQIIEAMTRARTAAQREQPE